MPAALAQEDIALPAAQVWALIGEFGGIRKWATVVETETVEESADGPVRILTMGNGVVVREVLAASSEFSYTYTLLDHPELTDHRGVVAVLPLDEKTCKIVLIAQASAVEGATDEETTTRWGKLVNGNLKAMKRALGV